MVAEYKRPVLRESAHFDDVAGRHDVEGHYLVAHDTAWALLNRVRSGVDEETVRRVIEVVDRQGIDEIAELWSQAPAKSLPGVLWRLYLIREVLTTNPGEALDAFRRGYDEARTIDPVLVGVASPAEAEALATLLDEILRGVFASDFVDALYRASSFCEILSLGFASVADSRDGLDDPHAAHMTQRALRYSVFAEDFRSAAKLWASGALA